MRKLKLRKNKRINYEENSPKAFEMLMLQQFMHEMIWEHSCKIFVSVHRHLPLERETGASFSAHESFRQNDVIPTPNTFRAGVVIRSPFCRKVKVARNEGTYGITYEVINMLGCRDYFSVFLQEGFYSQENEKESFLILFLYKIPI